MTKKEVIARLKDLMEDRESFFREDDEDDECFRVDYEALRLAVEMLEGESSMPLEDISAESERIQYGKCPECGSYCILTKANYLKDKGRHCTDCGQKFEWRKDDDNR